jgi:hypothetical protein
MSMKSSNDTTGNRTRFIAQCLNKMRHRVPPIPVILDIKSLCFFKGQRTVILYLLLQCDLKQGGQARGEVRRGGQLYCPATLSSSGWCMGHNGLHSHSKSLMKKKSVPLVEIEWRSSSLYLVILSYYFHDLTIYYLKVNIIYITVKVRFSYSCKKPHQLTFVRNVLYFSHSTAQNGCWGARNNTFEISCRQLFSSAYARVSDDVGQRRHV